MYHNFFDKAYVISLAQNSQIRQKFYNRVKEVNFSMDIEWFNSVYGKTVGAPEWWLKGRGCLGAWGCFVSHLHLIELAMTEHRRNILIFEDDAIFENDFVNRLNVALNELPDDWDMFFLGGQYLFKETKLPEIISSNICSCFNVNRSHAYAINCKAFRAIYKHLFDFDSWGIKHVDHRFGALHETGKINTYAVFPWLVGQDSHFSDISVKDFKKSIWNLDSLCGIKKINDNIVINYGSTGYGAVGINGELGYNKLKVELDIAKFNNKKLQWISAHAPSKLSVTFTKDIELVGVITKDITTNVGPCYFYVDGDNIGQLNSGNSATDVVNISSGTHSLCIFSDNKDFCHSVWGIREL